MSEKQPNFEGTNKKERIGKYAQTLLDMEKLPDGAAIHDYFNEPGGYIDNTFLKEDNKPGENWSDQPYPMNEEEIELLIRKGAKDLRTKE